LAKKDIFGKMKGGW